MQRFMLSLGSIFLGFLLGFGIKRYDVVVRKKVYERDLPLYIRRIRSIAFLVLNPLLLVLVFWVVDWHQSKVAAIPLLGLTALAAGGMFGSLFSRLLKHDKKSTGSMFAAGSFSNLGLMGGITCYMLFGEIGIVYVMVYKMFEDLYDYLVGYPIANMYGHMKDRPTKKALLKTIVTDPYVLIYCTAFTLGTILNLSKIQRPQGFQNFSVGLMLVTTTMMMTAIGYSLEGGNIRRYWKEGVCIASIKFLLIPLLITVIASWLKFQSISNGILYKILIVVSFSPPAFNSIIAPQIYGLDTDLANSCWIVCNVMYMVLIVPLLALSLSCGIL